MKDDLLERLRSDGENECQSEREARCVLGGLLDAAAQEIEQLREALSQMVYETTHLSPMENDGSHWCKISKEALIQARAALNLMYERN